MTTQEIINMYKGLNELSKKEFPAKVSFSIARNLHKIIPVIQDYDNAKLEVVIKNGGKPSDDNPSVYTIANMNEAIAEEMNREIQSLLDTENSDIVLSMINIEDLSSVNLSPEEIEAMLPMIEEE